MRSSKELTDNFFKDLRSFNATNFKTIAKADLSKQNATVHKAFSSVITRYFIFREKHPEIKEEEFKFLYFALSLDLVANYFANYPDTTTDNLIAFQLHLKNYMKEQQHNKQEEKEIDEPNTSLQNIELGPDNGMPVEQQPESVPDAI